MLNRKVDGALLIPSDFARRWHSGGAELQILVNGTDANQARIMQAYAAGAGRLMERGAGWTVPRSAGPVIVVDRMWFNETNDSHYFLVPGLIVMVMTIIGAFLTAMVVAREWERGTLEALFVTPMLPGEFLISKIIPYFGLGMIGFVLCVLAGQFPVPCAAPRVASAALPRRDGIPSGRPGNRTAGVHTGQEPVPRQPVGHDADLLAGDDAVGFPL